MMAAIGRAPPPSVVTRFPRTSVGQLGSAAGEQAALDAFVDGIHANVQIVIDVP
jgi:hypothetical protein